MSYVTYALQEFEMLTLFLCSAVLNGPKERPVNTV